MDKTGHAVKYKDLRDFIKQLEKKGELKRIRYPVDTHLEMTEICDRVLQRRGPCACCSSTLRGMICRCWPTCLAPQSASPWAWGRPRSRRLREVGELLAFLKEPEPPKGLKDAWSKLPIFKKVLSLSAKVVKKAPLSGGRARRRCGRFS